MPLYPFYCTCGNEFEVYYRMADMPRASTCDRCGSAAEIGIAKQQYIGCFKPRVTEDITGKPLEITSMKHLDTLCKEHNLTCDSTKFHRKPKFESAVDNLDYSTVKRTINRGTLEDGTPLEKPIRFKTPK